MASVVIHKGPIEASHSVSELPQSEWRALVDAWHAFIRVKLPYDCRELLRFVRESEVMLEPLGYTDTKDFIRRGLELDPKLVAWAVEGLKTIKPDEPVSFQDAVKLGKHGGDRKSAKAKDENQVDNVHLIGGNSAPYLLARLDRDNPELAEKVRGGELSAHAAAVEAGFRKKTVQIPADDPQRAAKAILRRCGADFVSALIMELGEAK